MQKIVITLLLFVGVHNLLEAQSYQYFPIREQNIIVFDKQLHCWQNDNGQPTLKIYNSEYKQIKEIKLTDEWKLATKSSFVIQFSNFYYVFIKGKNDRVAILKVDRNSVSDKTHDIEEKLQKDMNGNYFIYKANNCLFAVCILSQTKSSIDYSIHLLDSSLHILHKQIITMDHPEKVTRFKAIDDTTILISKYATQHSSQNEEAYLERFKTFEAVNDTTVVEKYHMSPQLPRTLMVYKLNMVTGSVSQIDLRSEDAYFLESQAFEDKKRNTFLLNRLLVLDPKQNNQRTGYSYIMKINERWKPMVYLTLSTPQLEDSLRLDENGFQDLNTGFTKTGDIFHLDFATSVSGISYIRASVIDSDLSKIRSSYYKISSKVSYLPQTVQTDSDLLILYAQSPLSPSIISGFAVSDSTVSPFDLSLNPNYRYLLQAARAITNKRFLIPYLEKTRGKFVLGFVCVDMSQNVR